ncbi:EVE domain-containing protein [Giardia muris]|uniref:EVE domain-containing protein n=1 Tax=Giardia muris TaxID=5742 RepID=A0A4Z1SP56_GIAMU|nr:EVE domain-containing protein [Giardia muris]|eukprot:TNJ26645.1 EVE domain-containing protein [Giardia muris]
MFSNNEVSPSQALSKSLVRTELLASLQQRPFYVLKLNAYELRLEDLATGPVELQRPRKPAEYDILRDVAEGDRALLIHTSPQARAGAVGLVEFVGSCTQGFDEVENRRTVTIPIGLVRPLARRIRISELRTQAKELDVYCLGTDYRLFIGKITEAQYNGLLSSE